MIIKNNILPPTGIKAINIFGFVFVRKEVGEKTIRHEKIHTRQMIELLFIGFYVWYFIELIVRAFTNRGYAYKNICFEREAYANDLDKDYLIKRKLYAWVKWI